MTPREIASLHTSNPHHAETLAFDIQQAINEKLEQAALKADIHSAPIARIIAENIRALKEPKK